jgi:hypothetical protein
VTEPRAANHLIAPQTAQITAPTQADLRHVGLNRPKGCRSPLLPIANIQMADVLRPQTTLRRSTMAESSFSRRPDASAVARLYGRPASAQSDPPDVRARHPTEEPEFISIPEWGRRLGISAESAYKAARLGQIPGCFNIGRLYRVNWSVFVAATSWMRSGSDESG